MNKKLQLRIQAIWQTLTEVPGWPDAPTSLRIRRILPISIPAAVFLVLAVWYAAVIKPRMSREREAHAPILGLVEQVEALRLVSPEADAAAVAQRAAEASKMLLASPSEAAAELENLQKSAQAVGWEASFKLLPATDTASRGGEKIAFVEARGRLAAGAGNADSYGSLIAWLETLSAAPKRIDLTRLSVRADEEGRHAVEISLRIGCRPES